MAYQDDKYENFLLKLGVSRPAFAKFADFAVEAVTAPGVDPLIVGHGAALKAAHDAFRVELVERIGAAGGSQTGTQTETDAFAKFKAFITTTNVSTLQPYLLTRPADAPLFYPDKLSGLTQATKKTRLTRLTAYTEALEAADATLPALPDGPRPGAAARALLTAYEAVFKAKTSSRTTLKDAIADLGPVGIALAECLWEVHCAALYVHRKEPKQARKYFDYAGLPGFITKGSRKKTL